MPYSEILALQRLLVRLKETTIGEAEGNVGTANG